MRATILIVTITLIAWIQQSEGHHRQAHQGHEKGNQTHSHTTGKPHVHSHSALQDVPTSAAPLPAPSTVTNPTKADNGSVSTQMNETKGKKDIFIMYGI